MKIYRHYKGQKYRVLHVGHHTETNDKLIVYQQLYENKYPYGYVWCRPIDMFNEEIVYENKKQKRFELIE